MNSWFRLRAGLGSIVFAAVAVCLPAKAGAGSKLIGQIGTSWISGITFDDAAPGMPLVQLASGPMLRLDPTNAATVQTYPLTSTVYARGLEYVANGLYYTTEGQPDALFAVTSSGTSTRIGTNINGSNFNFLDIALDPTTGKLWAVTDTLNGAAGHGYLFEINRQTGAGTLRATLGGLGQLISMTIDPMGRMFVSNATSGPNTQNQIFQIDPTTFASTPITTTGYFTSDFLGDFGYDPTSHNWFGVVEQRSANPRPYLLVQLTGMPAVPEPASGVLLGLAILAAMNLRIKCR